MSNKYKLAIYAVGFAVGFIGSSIIRKYIKKSKSDKLSENGHINSKCKIQSTIANMYNKLDELSAELDSDDCELDSGDCKLDDTDNFTDDCEIDLERKR